MQPPPLVQPEQILPNGLLVTLPYPMARRVEDGSIVFWHSPNRLTFWMTASALGSADNPVPAWNKRRSPRAYDELTERDGEIVRYCYRLAEDDDDDRQAAFYGYAASKDAALFFGAYFDFATQIDEVLATWRSIRPAPQS